MEETKVTFETAKLAKNKRFDIETHTVDYMLNGNYVGERGACISCTEYALAPTQSLLQKWLREIHNILIDVGSSFNGYSVEVMTKDSNNKWLNMEFSSDNEQYETYEEALEAGLQEALKLIK